MIHIDKIQISNFKCIKNLEAELPGIFLLTGANSSGKSSVIYALLSVFQSGEYPIDHLELNGDWLNLGDYDEVVYHHKNENDITIGISFKGNNIATTVSSDYEHSSEKMPLLKSFEISDQYINASFKKYGKKYLFEGTYDPRKDPFSEAYRSEDFRKFMKAVDSVNRKLPQPVDPFELYKINNFKEEYASIEEFKEEFGKSVILSCKVEDILTLSEKFKENFNFMGPFRYPPERTYYKKTKSDIRVNSFGENYTAQLLDWFEKYPEKFSAIKKALRELRLIDDLRFTRFHGGRFEMSVKTPSVPCDSNIADVGLGISQFLPVLVADMQLPEGSTLAVSQPEIHLHPSAQAGYANLMIKNFYQHKKRYIIETHSEYIINRLRLLIAKGEINEEDVKIIHLVSSEDGAIPYDIRLRKNGKIEGAPRDFFGTYQIDTLDLAIAAAENDD